VLHSITENRPIISGELIGTFALPTSISGRMITNYWWGWYV